MSLTEATRPYGGKSAGERRAERRGKLVATAIRLLADGGLAAATVREVADQAGVSRRFFYESFADLDALLDTVYQQVLTECATAVVEAVAKAPDTAQDKVNAAISSFIRIVEGNPSLFRAGFVEAAQSPALRGRMQAARDLFARLVSEQARAFYGFPDTADELVRFGSHLLVAGSVDTVTAWVDGRIDLTSDRLIELFVDHYLASAEAWVKAAKAIDPGWTPAAH